MAGLVPAILALRSRGALSATRRRWTVTRPTPPDVESRPVAGETSHRCFQSSQQHAGAETL